MEGNAIIVNTQVVRYGQLAITHLVPRSKNMGGFKMRDINSNIEKKGYWIFWLLIPSLTNSFSTSGH
jgi:hypothetical protein